MQLKQLFELVLAASLLIAAVSNPVYAAKSDNRKMDRREQPQRGWKEEYKKHPNQYRFDQRYRHDRYYPRTGYKLEGPRSGAWRVPYRGSDYYFDNGVWFRASGARYMAVAPPFGLRIGFLPSWYTTLWIGSIPYYYANDVYYTWQPNINAYVVTQPPADIEQQPTTVLADELLVYPKDGQSEQQQADDRYSCHRWSVDQTHYDPTQPPNNLAVNDLAVKRDAYQRAMRACLEGRNYSVR